MKVCTASDFCQSSPRDFPEELPVSDTKYSPTLPVRQNAFTHEYKIGAGAYIGSFPEWSKRENDEALYLVELLGGTLVARKSGSDKRHAAISCRGELLGDLTPPSMRKGVTASPPFNIEAGGSVNVADKAFHMHGASVFVMSAPQSHKNYYHWFAFYLPMLYFANQIKKRRGSVLLTPRLSQYQRETIEATGVSLAKVLEYEGPSISADSILLASCSFSIQRIRRECLPIYHRIGRELGGDKVSGAPDRLFLRRGNTKQRIVANENAVSERLSVHGFVTIDPGSLSLAEQAKLFKNVKHIVSSHGAALTNIVFSESLETVFECFSEHWMHGCYRDLVGTLGARYFYSIERSIPVEGIPPRELPYSIDLANIDTYLDSI